jgi:ParB-like chromosome segregation protein Spo0J
MAKTPKVAEVAELETLTEDPANPRTHTDQNIGMITDSIKAVGFGRSIVLDGDNVVRAGNGTLRAAKKAGLKKVRIIDVEGDEVVALRRKNLTDDQKKLLALFDNRAGELAGWNLSVLKNLPEHERSSTR